MMPSPFAIPAGDDRPDRQQRRFAAGTSVAPPRIADAGASRRAFRPAAERSSRRRRIAARAARSPIPGDPARTGRRQRLGIDAERQSLGHGREKGALVKHDVRMRQKTGMKRARASAGSHSTSQIWPGSIVGSVRRCFSGRYSFTVSLPPTRLRIPIAISRGRACRNHSSNFDRYSRPKKMALWHPTCQKHCITLFPLGGDGCSSPDGAWRRLFRLSALGGAAVAEGARMQRIGGRVLDALHRKTRCDVLHRRERRSAFCRSRRIPPCRRPRRAACNRHRRPCDKPP